MANAPTEEVAERITARVVQFGEECREQGRAEAAHVCSDYAHETDGAMTALECARRIRALPSAPSVPASPQQLSPEVLKLVEAAEEYRRETETKAQDYTMRRVRRDQMFAALAALRARIGGG
jgi:hypothetical protein